MRVLLVSEASNLHNLMAIGAMWGNLSQEACQRFRSAGKPLVSIW